jgi:hypothetical protein
MRLTCPQVSNGESQKRQGLTIKLWARLAGCAYSLVAILAAPECLSFAVVAGIQALTLEPRLISLGSQLLRALAHGATEGSFAQSDIDWCGACAALMAVVQPPGAHDSEGPKLVQHEPLLALDTLLQRCPTAANTAGASMPELVR